MSFHIKTKYLDDEAELVFGKYQDGSIALQLFSPEEGPLSTATVCLEGSKPAPGNVFIKDWSENEGTYDGLRKAGIIGESVRSHPAGFAIALECPLLVELPS
ncbi:hypothetical protein L3Y19_gp050 [Gordonia phage Neville]|uniref:Uncharacterized protein n=1 Tax=Gordonia phage Neville TaxID=2301693 RepID=A0A385E106_9CAUD|nr:hypothetical protein L3Y19_gp050 [Gordonia phage Neville]AXQ64419.1 hypothetical protein SEA_NEVILLE_50 [Gordonia phage Neville]